VDSRGSLSLCRTQQLYEPRELGWTFGGDAAIELDSSLEPKRQLAVDEDDGYEEAPGDMSC
jgi:hypothetical protein